MDRDRREVTQRVQQPATGGVEATKRVQRRVQLNGVGRQVIHPRDQPRAGDRLGGDLLLGQAGRTKIGVTRGDRFREAP